MHTSIYYFLHTYTILLIIILYTIHLTIYYTIHYIILYTIYYILYTIHYRRTKVNYNLYLSCIPTYFTNNYLHLSITIFIFFSHLIFFRNSDYPRYFLFCNFIYLLPNLSPVNYIEGFGNTCKIEIIV